MPLLLAQTATPYLVDLRRSGGVISREEEHALAVEYQRTGDRRIADRLVCANLKLVVKMANDYRRSRMPVEDLIQEGNLGLMKAVEKFDPSCGSKLTTYAAFWIRAYMLHYIMAGERLVKIGTTQAQRKLYFNLRSTRQAMEAKGETVDATALAAKLGVTEDEVREMDSRLGMSEISMSVGPCSEDSDDDRPRTAGSIAGNLRARPDVQTEDAEVGATVRRHLAEFEGTIRDHRRLAIYRERLMVDVEDATTLAALAERFGVTRERVRQLEVSVKNQIRKWLVDRMDEDSLAAA